MPAAGRKDSPVVRSRAAVAAMVLGLIAAGCTKRIVLLPGPGRQLARPTLITGARVFDGERLLGPTDVLLEGGVVSKLGPPGELAVPEGVERIDANGKTLLPGLIDLHLHAGALQGEAPFAISLLDPPRAEEQLAAALFCGVTTVLLAGHEADNEALAEAERAGGLASPRLFRASRIFTATGGHPETLYKEALPWPISAVFLSQSVIPVTTPEEAREELRAEIARHHPSVIKIVYDDLPPGGPRLSVETLRALIDEAHAHSIRAVVHVGGPEEAVTAVAAGASLLMHPPWESELSDAQVSSLAAAHVPLVTTLRVWARAMKLLKQPATDFAPLEFAVMQPGVAESFAAGPPPGFKSAGYSPEFLEQAQSFGPVTGANLKKLHAAGVPLLVGTDSGVTGIFQGAAVHRELAALVGLGFSPEETLAMATSRAGEFLAPGSGLGTIAPGAPADLLLVGGDPIADINSTEQIQGVWHRGLRVR